MAQELPLRARLVPVARKADCGAVGQPEAGNVNRLALRMLAPAPGGSRILPPAGIAAEMIDACRTAAELVKRQRLHNLTLEFVETVGERAAHCRGLIERGMNAADLDGRIDRAMRVTQAGEAGAAAQCGMARRAAAAPEQQREQATGCGE